MSSQQTPLIIKDWNGIAESPHKGFGLFRNADLQSFPERLKSTKKREHIFTASLQEHSLQRRQLMSARPRCDRSKWSKLWRRSGIFYNNRNTSGWAFYKYDLFPYSSFKLTTFKVATSYKNSVGTVAAERQ